MADLIVRGLSSDLVKALKERAARNGRSAEAEHRAILIEALGRRGRPHLAEFLLTMPRVGRDDDFARTGAECRPAARGHP